MLEGLKSPEIIIFGGAFDPPHQGHVDCVLATKKRFPDALILVVPAFQPAGASGEHKNTSLSFENRLELCEAIFGKYDSSCKVVDVEKNLPRPNYTIITLKHIMAMYPNFKRFGFLMGLDQYLSFPRWSQPTEIIKKTDLVVVKRSYETDLTKKNEDEMSLKDHGQMILKDLGCDGVWDDRARAFLITKTKTLVYFIDEKISTAESHLIREWIKEGKNIPYKWIPSESQKLLNKLAKSSKE